MPSKIQSNKRNSTHNPRPNHTRTRSHQNNKQKYKKYRQNHPDFPCKEAKYPTNNHNHQRNIISAHRNYVSKSCHIETIHQILRNPLATTQNKPSHKASIRFCKNFVQSSLKNSLQSENRAIKHTPLSIRNLLDRSPINHTIYGIPTQILIICKILNSFRLLQRTRNPQTIAIIINWIFTPIYKYPSTYLYPLFV